MPDYPTHYYRPTEFHKSRIDISLPSNVQWRFSYRGMSDGKFSLGRQHMYSGSRTLKVVRCVWHIRLELVGLLVEVIALKIQRRCTSAIVVWFLDMEVRSAQVVELMAARPRKHRSASNHLVASLVARVPSRKPGQTSRTLLRLGLPLWLLQHQLVPLQARAATRTTFLCCHLVCNTEATPILWTKFWIIAKTATSFTSS